MSDGTFAKVSDSSEKLLYGPRRLLLCGFNAEAQDKMGAFFEMIGMADIDRVWASPGDGEKTVGELMNLSNDTGRGIDSGLPRAVIMAGITEKELHFLVDSCHRAGMRQALFATLTPVSEAWSLVNLLRELGHEREALAAADPS